MESYIPPSNTFGGARREFMESVIGEMAFKLWRMSKNLLDKWWKCILDLGKVANLEESLVEFVEQKCSMIGA